jgi:hypothetical protein
MIIGMKFNSNQTNETLFHFFVTYTLGLVVDL